MTTALLAFAVFAAASLLFTALFLAGARWLAGRRPAPPEPLVPLFHEPPQGLRRATTENLTRAAMRSIAEVAERTHEKQRMQEFLEANLARVAPKAPPAG